MNGKQKKSVVKIGVALISVLGMTAIGVTSAFAGVNKQYQPVSDTVKCEAYSDIYHQNYVGTEYLSNSKCNWRVNKNYNGFYWQNAGS
ncbi:hypothetical protein N0Y54_32725 [Nostoc punctiforme UO1]|uniref:hypothetical protein n=1 Tax=Nostoc punctiforme TaxID=272131 RepID=UPI0030A47068